MQTLGLAFYFDCTRKWKQINRFPIHKWRSGAVPTYRMTSKNLVFKWILKNTLPGILQSSDVGFTLGMPVVFEYVKLYKSAPFKDLFLANISTICFELSYRGIRWMMKTISRAFTTSARRLLTVLKPHSHKSCCAGMFGLAPKWVILAKMGQVIICTILGQADPFLFQS